ncbi:MAG: PAS domain S-box protein [Alphaproteobacteria bacterium]|nr:PAS domain S-box protein [Alphaproteobacteria bacterium]
MISERSSPVEEPPAPPYLRALIAVSAVFGLVVALIVVGLGAYEIRTNTEAVRQRLHQDARIIAFILSEPVRRGDREAVGRLLGALAMGPALRRAWVEDDQGRPLAETIGKDADRGGDRFRESAAIHAFADRTGAPTARVTIEVSDRRVDEAWRGALAVYGTALAGLLVFVVAGAWLLLRLYVRPLASQVDSRTVELARSERRFRDFAEGGGDWLWEQDAELRFTYMSPSNAQFTGMASHEHYGKRQRETGMLGVSEAEWAAHDGTVAARQPLVDFRFQRVDSDGRTRHLSVNGRPVFDAAGNFMGYRGVGRDITERIEADARENAAWHRLEDAVESLADGFALFDGDQRLILVNQAHRQIFGSVAPIGTTLRDIVQRQRESDAYPAGYVAGLADIDQRVAAMWAGGTEIEVPLHDGKWLRVTTRRAAENGLVVLVIDITQQKATEQRYRDFAESSGDWQWEMDGELRFTYMSANVERVVGVKPEWHYGKSRRDLLGPNYDSALWGKHLSVLDARQPFRDFVYPRVGAGVEPKWVKSSGVPFFAPDGSFQGYRGVGSDVTAEIEAHRTLRALIDVMPNLITVKDLDGRFIMVNRATAAFHGKPQAELLGKRTGELLPGAIAPIMDEMEARLIETRSLVEPREIMAVGPDGREHQWLVTKAPFLGPGGAVHWIITSATDITELKAAQSRLEAIAGRLHRQNRALEALARNEALAGDDIEGMFRAATETLAATLGVGRASVWRLARDRSEIVSADLFEAADKGHSAGIRLEAKDYPGYFAALLEERVIDAADAHGDPRTREFSASYLAPLGIGAMLDAPIRVAGTLHGVVCCEHLGGARTWEDDERSFATAVADLLALAQESVERRNTEGRFLQAQKMEAIGQLTGGMAHDFNNLLGVIIGNLDLLSEDLAGNPASLARIEAVIGASERGARLIGQLLAFSRSQTLQPVAVDVGDTVTRLRGMLAPLLGETIRIETRVAADVWPCRVDPGQLESAIVNLAVNARDAMPRGGTLTVAVENVVLDEVYATQVPDARIGDYVSVAVGDTGEGISTDVLGRVFEPFFTTKEVGHGSGLGLNMVDGFVRQSGGHVHIHSEIGHGTRIVIFLPREAGADPAQQSRPVEDAQGFRVAQRRRVLVVEDNPAMSDLVQRMLAALDCEVEAVDNGTDALARIEGRDDIDLLFTDIVMPGTLNGIEVAHRAALMRPDLKIVFTSGFSESAVPALGNGGKPALLLRKPYRRAEMLEVLTRVFA